MPTLSVSNEYAATVKLSSNLHSLSTLKLSAPTQLSASCSSALLQGVYDVDPLDLTRAHHFLHEDKQKATQK